MKTLICIRHAKSSWDNASLRDIDRPLNKRGLRDAPRMAQFLKDKGIVPDMIVTSPAKRAFSTATFFKEMWNLDKEDMEIDENIYEATESDIWEIVRQLPDEANTALLFGHNPTFTYFANHFSEDIISNVPTCGICQIESTTRKWSKLDTDNSELVAFYYPKMLSD
ncbi:MAG: histidine phosphatase family protein [Bacteroidota bacterium]